MHDGKAVVGFSEYTDNTTVHPVGLTLLILLGIAMLCVPRRHTMLVLFACASFIAVGQRIVVFSCDFNFVRVMVLIAWTRILLRGETAKFKWSRMDTFVTAWTAATFALFITSHGLQTIVYKLGNSFDSIGMYFLVRCFVKDLDDVKSAANSMAIIGIVVACFFVIEYTTKRNMFSVFGGVPEITPVREGKLRCQGAYAHPILAGCFWAVIAPLLGARAMTPGGSRFLSIMGFLASVTIVALSNSSTSIVGGMAAMLGFMIFPLRQSMRQVRWAIVVFLIGLQTVMVSPVYCLIARITLSSGNTGSHRVAIIEAAIKYCSEWVLCGTANINHWGIYKNDITNKYVAEAISGGAIEVALFLMLIVTAFGNVGRLWRKVTRVPGDVLLAWAIGVSMFVHVVNFIGVTYFGQNEALWNVSLALTAVLPPAMAQRRLASAITPHFRRIQTSRYPGEMARL